MDYKKVKTAKGEIITLEGKPFASGGEGEIRKIISPTKYADCCVKLYRKNMAKEQAKKIDFMLQNPPEHILTPNCVIGWPKESIYENGTFAGFMMPLAFKESKELQHLVVGKLSKKLDNEWHRKFGVENGVPAIIARLKVIYNISIPICYLHNTNKYVLKDFKPQNVLITHEGKVSIVDMDSIQIAENQRLLFPGTAATPHYVPPEAYQRSFNNNTLLEKSWDCFAVGVVFYQILFGLHPYTATPKKENDDNDPIQASIQSNLFPFGANKHEIKSYPELHNKFIALPLPVQQLFKRTFSLDYKNRPTIFEWNKVLGEVLKAIPNPKLTSARKHPSKSQQFDFVGSFYEGLAIVKQNGKYGFIDRNNNVVIKPIYDNVLNFKNGITQVKLGYEVFKIDKRGNRVQITLDTPAKTTSIPTSNSHQNPTPPIIEKEEKSNKGGLSMFFKITLTVIVFLAYILLRVILGDIGYIKGTTLAIIFIGLLGLIWKKPY
jgi:probable serine/threonine-protein kinase tsuA